MGYKKCSFSSYGAIVILLFYSLAVFVPIFSFDLIYASVSLIFSSVFAVLVSKRKAMKFIIFIVLPALLIFPLFNFFFVHDGQTALLFFSDSPLTLESLLFGLTSGVVFSCTILWLYTFNSVADGKFFKPASLMLPQTALVFSMTLKLIPKMSQRAREISEAQTLIGKGIRGNSLWKKIKHGVQILSILITWSLENSIESADSLLCRGYGVKAKRAKNQFVFRPGDFLCAVFLFATIVCCIVNIAIGGAQSFYPVFGIAVDQKKIVCVSFFAFACFLPVLSEILKEIKWRFLKSKI